MGNEKRRSKGGNYVGGFLQMFDWNMKSRKKLFSSKYSPEQSKQKKQCDRSFPTAHFRMLDEDESSVEPSVKGSGSYSCASSVTDEEPYSRTKAPGVVARLMGLDSLPKSNIPEPHSTPLFETQSLKEGYNHRSRCFQYHQDRHDVGPKEYENSIHRSIEKFRVEALPPKSAKSIPITHHKLLSPIKTVNYTPSKDAAHIMEAAARIIEPGPHMSAAKPKLPHVGSSLAPLRVWDLREKAQATQKLSKAFECSQKKDAAKNYLKGQQSTGETLGKEFGDSEAKVKGRSISLALQAKANVQKREGLNINSSRSLLSYKETSDSSPKQVFKSQSTADHTVPKVPKKHGSNVLRQNNQKQNCSNVDRGKPPFKPSSQEGKTPNGDAPLARQRNVSRLSGNSRKLGSEEKKDNNNSSQRITSKKRSVDEDHYSERSQNSTRNKKSGKNSSTFQSHAAVDNSRSWDRDSGSSGAEVVSFTFTAPMPRNEPSSTGAGERSSKIYSAGSRAMLGPDPTNGTEYSYAGYNVKGNEDLSTLLEEKLKELALNVEFSHKKPGICLGHEDNGKLSMMERNQKENAVVGLVGAVQHPRPVSLLEHPLLADSYSSWDTSSHSSITGGLCTSLFEAQEAVEALPLEMHFPPKEDTADLSDSASSSNVLSEQQITLNKCDTPVISEIDYVKDMICNTELKFEDFALGKTPNIIDYRHIKYSPIGNRRLLFDCVNECMGLRFRPYVSGGLKLWAKGESLVRRKEKLAEEVSKEISDWSAMGDAMVDELVDKDMSSSQCGKWLEYDVEAFELGKQIESRILNSLVDEVVADLLVL